MEKLTNDTLMTPTPGKLAVMRYETWPEIDVILVW